MDEMKSKRTKALEIPKEVKEKVLERDEHCIVCGNPVDAFFASAHYIPRSKGGLGIKENVVALCFHCHRKYDQGIERKVIGEFIKNHLERHYPGFKDEDRIYRK